jgi:pantoate--beta-alanine ligase
MIRSGERDARKVIKAMEDMVREKPTAKVDYIEAVDARTLKPLDEISGETLIALAVFIGKTRLIDSAVVAAGG